MAIEPGDMLSHYRVIEKIGEGGMGVVWKAEDTVLGRQVAIKVLPEAFSTDRERLARFEREAKLLASLNHPNIAAIHGLERSGEAPYLVLELVPGETLEERLARGALPVPEALLLARQMTVALQAAHQAGVLHRDLKPANIKVTPDGEVKVLDFGLAKAQEGSAKASDPSLSPTLTTAGTQVGVVLGTAAYMSPEQARGLPVDRRADVWGFGCVLFECLTGNRPFDGRTISDVLASVLKTEPDWTLIPAATPPAIRRLLRRCLAKEPDDRLHDIADARLEIDEALDPSSGDPDVRTAAVAPAPRRGRWLLAGISLLTGTLLASIFWSLRISEPPLFKFRLPVTSIKSFQEPGISPDGTRIVYGTGGPLLVREFDQLDPLALPGTEGARTPIWSPDSRFIAFARGRKLFKVPAAGGDVTAVADLPREFGGGAGGGWTEDDRIIFSTGGSGLLSVSARGGDVETLLGVAPQKEADFHEPSLLPDGRGILFVVHANRGIDAIDVYSDGARKEVLRMPNQRLESPVWSPSGHLVFHRTVGNPGIWAVPFSLENLEATGDPFLVAPEGTWPSVSRTGMLAYRSGVGLGEHQIAWLDSEGRVGDILGTAKSHIDDIILSPDGTLAAASVNDGGSWNLWVHDLQRGNASRLTFDAEGTNDPIWAPDGSRIAYISRGDDTINTVTLDGTREALPISGASELNFAPDGTLVYVVKSPSTLDDIWYLPPGEGAEPVAFLTEGGRYNEPQVSPDGRFLAYISDESDRDELYVRMFPHGEGKWQISNDGARGPRWSPAGDRLYYQLANKLIAADIRPGDRFSAEGPRTVFDTDQAGIALEHGYAVASGGRFLVVKVTEGDPQRAGIAIVQNWFSEFQK